MDATRCWCGSRRGPSAGILKIAFDENEAIPPVDCYAPTITAGDPVDLGTYELTAGEHPLTFMFIGVNPANKEKLNKFGVDYVKLVPMPPIEPVHFPGHGRGRFLHSLNHGRRDSPGGNKQWRYMGLRVDETESAL